MNSKLQRVKKNVPIFSDNDINLSPFFPIISPLVFTLDWAQGISQIWRRQVDNIKTIL
jgi:hypothetical protein